jgi:hypothetical protein
VFVTTSRVVFDPDDVTTRRTTLSHEDRQVADMAGR